MSDIKHTDLHLPLTCQIVTNVDTSRTFFEIQGNNGDTQFTLKNVHLANHIILACNSYYESQAKIASQEEAIRELVEVIRVTTDALEQITKFGGNISDESLMTRTGPNDAEARGVMYVNAREVANEAIAKAIAKAGSTDR